MRRNRKAEEQIEELIEMDKLLLEAYQVLGNEAEVLRIKIQIADAKIVKLRLSRDLR